MTAILRQVDKTFTFEEQRVEINEIGLDLYNLRLQEQEDFDLSDFTVDTATLASGGGSLSYAVTLKLWAKHLIIQPVPITPVPITAIFFII